MRFDLHVHSQYSHDGRMTCSDLIAAARRAGLSGLAVCDHNTLRGSVAAQANCPSDFVIIPGVEYSTDLGHVLAYFITRGAEDTSLPRLDNGCFLFSALAPFIKEQGGLLVAAHPLRNRDSIPGSLLNGVDGLEVFNARQMARWPQTTAPTLRQALTRDGLFTAGSDAHRFGEVGGAYVELEARTPEDVRTALLSGQYACHGRPARRRHEALGRLGRHGLSGWPKDLARLAVFTAQDIRDTVTGVYAWRQFDMASK